jgi:hypothetical protein
VDKVVGRSDVIDLLQRGGRRVARTDQFARRARQQFLMLSHTMRARSFVAVTAHAAHWSALSHSRIVVIPVVPGFVGSRRLKSSEICWFMLMPGDRLSGRWRAAEREASRENEFQPVQNAVSTTSSSRQPTSDRDCCPSCCRDTP